MIRRCSHALDAELLVHQLEQLALELRSQVGQDALGDAKMHEVVGGRSGGDVGKRIDDDVLCEVVDDG